MAWAPTCTSPMTGTSVPRNQHQPTGAHACRRATAMTATVTATRSTSRGDDQRRRRARSPGVRVEDREAGRPEGLLEVPEVRDERVRDADAHRRARARTSRRRGAARRRSRAEDAPESASSGTFSHSARASETRGNAGVPSSTPSGERSMRWSGQRSTSRRSARERDPHRLREQAQREGQHDREVGDRGADAPRSARTRAARAGRRTCSARPCAPRPRPPTRRGAGGPRTAPRRTRSVQRAPVVRARNDEQQRRVRGVQDDVHEVVPGRREPEELRRRACARAR